MRPPGIKTNDSDHKDARLEEFIKTVLCKYDIICNQELFNLFNSRKERLIEAARKAGFLYHAVSEAPGFFSGFLVDGGLLTLSRFPIVKSEFRSFPYGCGADDLSMKGVLYTRIQIGDNNHPKHMLLF